MRFACIDIGTNSVRYLAAEIDSSGQPVILDQGLATPRLGEGLTETGSLSDEAIDRTISELSRIKNELESMGVREFRCVGTEALRIASNAGTFLRRAGEAGLTVTVLSGEEEARLVYTGALYNITVATEGKVLADVGGGSTEIITARGEGEPHFISLPLGCVRLREQFRMDTEPDRAGLDRMREHCRNILREHYPESSREAIKESGEYTLIGLGGTFTTLAAIHLGLPTYDRDRVHGSVLTAKEIGRIEEKLVRLPLAERKNIPGLEPSRADIIIPGTIIVQSIMDHLGLSRVTISDRGLLWGQALKNLVF
ncbi:MAG: Ppx/GppA phosphatase family protein [Candidatus Euphemobacter frigidus]|nr:Ppx/GppA phosphatase family protein [Candidatus Euphemobacter frigidus]MDP8276776.1 Ppx/GppA phosphatase family protein [Candidatus Euphemobacter frigidus]